MSTRYYARGVYYMRVYVAARNNSILTAAAFVCQVVIRRLRVYDLSKSLNALGQRGTKHCVFSAYVRGACAAKFVIEINIAPGVIRRN